MLDLWDNLALCKKPILLCGMGLGGDKILSVCKEKGVKVSGVFASDSFARGNLYSGMPVLSFSEACDRFGDFAVLLSFGSSIPEVISYITDISHKKELYAPSVPIAGNDIFDSSYYNMHKSEFDYARSLFSDERSALLFDNMIAFYLSGNISYLTRDISTPDEIYSSCLSPSDYSLVCDMGAYTGDSVCEFYSRFPHLSKIISFEPDKSNYKKLSAAAASLPENICEIYNCAAYSRSCTMLFSNEGSRNSALCSYSVSSDSVSPVSSALSKSNPTLQNQVDCRSLDSVCGMRHVDFIKYDVEGAEEEAIIGSARTISRSSPDLLVSAYHRSSDLFRLPDLIRKLNKNYRLYLRRYSYIPAWDLNIIATTR